MIYDLFRTTSLWFKLGQALLHFCQGAEDPAHGDIRPQIRWKNCELAVPYLCHSFYDLQHCGFSAKKHLVCK